MLQLADVAAPPGHATWSTSTACRPTRTGPTSPTTSAPSCWPASWPAGSTTGAAVARTQRKPGTLDELAGRRGRMNPRLSLEWLRYLVTVGARHDPDGWRWKIDPAHALRRLRAVAAGVGAGRGCRGLAMPLLAVLG